MIKTICSNDFFIPSPWFSETYNYICLLEVVNLVHLTKAYYLIILGQTKGIVTEILVYSK